MKSPELVAAETDSATETGEAESAVDEVLELTPQQIADQAVAEEAAEREAQLQRLLERMQRNADFPSLRDSIRSIQGVARSESAHLRTLTEQVLGDPALSNKLLRMINTAYYSSVGGGTIDSLSRAVALMGFAPVAMLASSLTLFDRLPKGPDGARVQKEFGRALLAAMLANQFCPVRQQEESAYVVALFQNLGTMLAWMHFPQEAAEIEAITDQIEGADHQTLQQTSRKVLGISYEDLAVEVTRSWGWPESLQLSLRRLEPLDPEKPASKEEFLRMVCTAANRLAQQLEQIDDPAALEQCLNKFKQRYAVPLGLDGDDLPERVEAARTAWGDLALVLGFSRLQPKKPKALAHTGSRSKEESKTAVSSSKSPARAAGASRRPNAAAQRSDPAVAAALASALSSISQQAMSDTPLADVLQMVMNLLRDSLKLRRVIICLRDSSTGELVGRHGVGDKAAKLAPLFRIPMRPPADLMGLLCAKQADTLISDTSDPIIVKRLPDWFKQQVKAPCFVLLPLSMGDQPIGLIYGDCSEGDSLSINDNELTLLKALRNQLVMAMRLRGVSG